MKLDSSHIQRSADSVRLKSSRESGQPTIGHCTGHQWAICADGAAAEAAVVGRQIRGNGDAVGSSSGVGSGSCICTNYFFPFNQREKIKAARLALMGLCVPRIGRTCTPSARTFRKLLVACSVVRCCCYFRHAVRRTANIVYYIIISARSHAHLHTEAHEGPAIRLLQYGVAGAGSRKLNLPPRSCQNFPSALRLQRSIPRASEITSTPLARGPRAYNDCIYVLPACPGVPAGGVNSNIAACSLPNREADAHARRGETKTCQIRGGVCGTRAPDLGRPGAACAGAPED